MTPEALADLVRTTVAQLLADRGLDSGASPKQVTVERPRNPEHGDYATNLALQVAKKVGVHPRDFAGVAGRGLLAKPTASRRPRWPVPAS